MRAGAGEREKQARGDAGKGEGKKRSLFSLFPSSLARALSPLSFCVPLPKGASAEERVISLLLLFLIFNLINNEY